MRLITIALRSHRPCLLQINSHTIHCNWLRYITVFLVDGRAIANVVRVVPTNVRHLDCVLHNTEWAEWQTIAGKINWWHRHYYDCLFLRFFGPFCWRALPSLSVLVFFLLFFVSPSPLLLLLLLLSSPYGQLLNSYSASLGRFTGFAVYIDIGPHTYTLVCALRAEWPGHSITHAISCNFFFLHLLSSVFIRSFISHICCDCCCCCCSSSFAEHCNILALMHGMRSKNENSKKMD